MSHTLFTTTSANRPTHEPGRLAYETDTGRVIISDGYNWHVFAAEQITSGTYSVPHVSIYQPVSIHTHQTILDLLSSFRAKTE